MYICVGRVYFSLGACCTVLCRVALDLAAKQISKTFFILAGILDEVQGEQMELQNDVFGAEVVEQLA